MLIERGQLAYLSRGTANGIFFLDFLEKDHGSCVDRRRKSERRSWSPVAYRGMQLNFYPNPSGNPVGCPVLWNGNITLDFDNMGYRVREETVKSVTCSTPSRDSNRNLECFLDFQGRGADEYKEVRERSSAMVAGNP